jgi:hypothetical protein
MRRLVRVSTSGRVAAVGVLAFLATCPLLFRGGSTDGDIPVFRRYGDLILSGHVPYRDFWLEYPPGALPFFIGPSLADKDSYLSIFRLIAAAGIVLGIVLLALLLGRLQAGPRLHYAAVLFAAITPALLGAFTLRRFDMWPAALCIGVLYLLLIRKARLAFALLAVATLLKTFPVVLLPLALLWTDRRERVRALGVFCAIGLVVLVPFAAIAHGGLYNSYAAQIYRHLHLDSLGSSILLVLNRPLETFYDKGWSVRGSGAETIAGLQTVLELSVVAVVVVLYARSRRGPWELVAAATAALAAAACLGKVFSPQYLLWVAPLILLARSRLAVVLCTAALLLTNLLYPDRYFGLLAQHEGEAWLLFARNMLAVAMTAALLYAVFRARVGTSRESGLATRVRPGLSDAGRDG